MSLDTFAANFQIALAKNHPGYKLSGVAEIYRIGGSIFYSASIYPSDPSVPFPKPEQLFPIFQAMAVENFMFRTCEVLAFQSSSKLPDPKWRIQLAYSHNVLA